MECTNAASMTGRGALLVMDHPRRVAATQGVREGARYACARLLEEYFDRRMSVSTAGY